MEKKSISINLIKGQNKGFWDKFIKWALGFGRLIVIVTELIALGTFLYRFSLDRELIDLHDKISQKQAIVKLLKNDEDKYRNLQNRLKIASKLSATGLRINELFNDIVSFAPEGFVFTNIVLSEDYVKIEAKIQSVTSLATFVKTLKNHPKINSVSLDKIENKMSSATIAVGITATLKK